MAFFSYKVDDDPLSYSTSCDDVLKIPVEDITWHMRESNGKTFWFLNEVYDMCIQAILHEVSILNERKRMELDFKVFRVASILIDILRFICYLKPCDRDLFKTMRSFVPRALMERMWNKQVIDFYVVVLDTGVHFFAVKEFLFNPLEGCISSRHKMTFLRLYPQYEIYERMNPSYKLCNVLWEFLDVPKGICYDSDKILKGYLERRRLSELSGSK